MFCFVFVFTISTPLRNSSPSRLISTFMSEEVLKREAADPKLSDTSDNNNFGNRVANRPKLNEQHWKPRGDFTIRDVTYDKLIGKRQVWLGDAEKFLNNHADELIQDAFKGASVVTSIPDVIEVNKLLEEWKEWFKEMAYLILKRVEPEMVAIFYQTDIKVDGRWIDKGFLVQQAAEKAESSLLWHKIVCIVPPNCTKFSRPGYSHMLCFSKERREPISIATPDIIERGDMIWGRAMGLQACMTATRYIKNHVTGCRLVIDPFCGLGSVLSVANEFGLDSLGVEISKKRAKEAALLVTRTLQFDKEEEEAKKRSRQKSAQNSESHITGEKEDAEFEVMGDAELTLHEQQDDGEEDEDEDGDGEEEKNNETERQNNNKQKAIPTKDDSNFQNPSAKKEEKKKSKKKAWYLEKTKQF